MIRHDLIPKARVDNGRARNLRAFVASCACHGLLLCLILWAAYVYRSHLPRPRSGSAPGTPTITLQTLLISSPPPAPPIPAPTPPVLATPVPSIPAASVTESQHEPEPKPAPPEQGVPVLAAPPMQPKPVPPAKSIAAHSSIFHPTIAAAQPHPRPEPAMAATPSSYAPGPSLLPHPPYPEEARDLRETGTVLMSVQFDAGGGVAEAEVTQSSGVPVLDLETRSFIRTHWHSAAYAGRTVNVPIRYTLENL